MGYKKNLKKVFEKTKYRTVFALATLIAFVLLYLLTVVTNSFNLGVFVEMNGGLFTAISLLLTAIVSMLFGLYASMSLYKYDLVKNLTTKNTSISAGGAVTAIFSAGCPTCGSLLLPLIGISSLAIFPLQGIELKLASIALLGMVNVRLAKTIDKCDTQLPKTSTPLISKGLDKAVYGSIVIVGALLLFNQAQITGISSEFDLKLTVLSSPLSSQSETGLEVSETDISQVNSTAMAVATVFPVNGIQSQEDAIALMLSAGTPEYSDALGGITFDDPVTSMEYLVKWFPTIKAEVKQNNPEAWQRYLNLAAKPRGISCEYCCGLSYQGAREDGESMCGCKHNPALLALTLGLLNNTDYNDAEVLREALRWKAMFFPQDMVSLAMEVAGTDPSELKNLPGMVGGC
jgi:hypothetical protein